MSEILLSERIKQIMMAYAQTHGAQSHADFGRIVADAEGRPEPYSADDVFGWLSPLGNNAPSLATLTAIGSLINLGGDRMRYLAFGNEWPIHALEEADYDRVHGRNGRRGRR